MLKKIYSRRMAEFAVLFGMLCAVLMSMARFDAACDDLRGNVLRLHIIANSDSSADQSVKLQVRDEILKKTSDLFKNQTELSIAEKTAEENLDKFTEIANEVLREKGYSYTAMSEIGDSYFETRKYEKFTLPAGTYRSLIIRLGKSEGKNWWCVVFPAMCIPAAENNAKLSDSTAKKSEQIAEHPQKYIMKFKVVEIYEDLKMYLSKK